MNASGMGDGTTGRKQVVNMVKRKKMPGVRRFIIVRVLQGGVVCREFVRYRMVFKPKGKKHYVLWLGKKRDLVDENGSLVLNLSVDDAKVEQQRGG